MTGVQFHPGDLVAPINPFPGQDPRWHVQKVSEWPGQPTLVYLNENADGTGFSTTTDAANLYLVDRPPPQILESENR